jgi:hypothetical protein
MNIKKTYGGPAYRKLLAHHVSRCQRLLVMVRDSNLVIDDMVEQPTKCNGDGGEDDKGVERFEIHL